MKKFISLLIVILMLTASIVSCADTSNDSETSADITSDTTESTSAESTSAKTESTSEVESSKNTEDTYAQGDEETYADGLIRLSKGGTALYRVVRPDKASTPLKNVATDFTKALNNLNCDAKFELKTDNYPLPQYLEILIGDTSFKESSDVIKTLGVGGWAVRKIGGKIVICGSNEDTLNAAIEYFHACVSVNSEGDAVIDLANGGYTYTGQESFFSADRPLSSFSIVYGSGLIGEATELKNKIKSLYSIDLPLKADTEAAVKNEILVGDCERSEVESALESVDKKTDGFVVKASESKLIIAGHSATSTKVALNIFMTKYLISEYSKAPQVVDGLNEKYDSSFGDLDETQARPDGAEVRIMSFNVLSENFGDKIPASSRKVNASGTIIAYLPDVIGFQEFDKGYQNAIMPLLEDYELICATKDDGSVGYNGIAYNKTTLNLIKKGYVEYRQTAQARYHKYLSYGVFTTKSTGETFAVINLHWDATKNDYKMMQCEDTVALIEKISSENGGCPIFVTGDYNANRHTDYFKALLTNGDMLHSEITAVTKVNDEYNTYHGVPLGTLPGLKDTSIDHVVHTKNSTALFYKVIIDLPTLYASDHCPIIADFSLN